jgi:hypothetical protein
MEPFHQLAVEAGTDFETVFRNLNIATRWSDRRFLVDKPEGFRTLICERDGDQAVFSVGRRDINTLLFIYVNTLGDSLTRDMRQHLESEGAEWGYYHR